MKIVFFLFQPTNTTMLPLLLTVSLLATSAVVAQKPNIIYIMADDLGWNDVGFHNQYGEIKTPNIDSLAQDGVELTNYYTAPYCGPSRAQLLTGK